MWLRLIAFVAFVSLGLPDGLLGVAWPSMREATGVPLAALGQLLAAGTAGYLISSVASGAVVSRIGVGKLLAGSTLLVVVALAILAASRAWPMILVAGALSGLGAGAIDAGVNLFAAKAMSARAMLFLHASYGVGATLGPLIMTAAVARGGAGAGEAGALGYGLGYAAVAGIMVPLIVVFAGTARAWDGGDRSRGARGSSGGGASLAASARSGRVLVGVAAFVLYAGLEVTAGQWAYSLLTMGRGLEAAVAGTLVSVYWGALTLGRVGFGLAAGRFAASRLVVAGLVLALGGAAVLWAGTAGANEAVAWISGVGLAMLGAGLAPVYPMLMTLTPARVGEAMSGHAVGLQVAGAYVGTATLPGLVGVMATRWGLEAVGPALLVGAAGLLVLIVAGGVARGGGAVRGERP